jgi:thiol:disulfide interchange protein DsbC
MFRNKSVVRAALFGLVLILAAPACSAQKASSPTLPQVAERMKEMNPGIEVLEVRPAPISGLVEVLITFQGQKKVIYMDAGRKFILDGIVFEIDAKKNLTEERMEEVNRIDVSRIPLDDAIALGPRSAPIKVVVFDDPD